MAALLQMPLEHLKTGDKILAASMVALMSSAVTMWSIQACLLISAIYIPSLLILQALMSELAERANPDSTMEKREEWLKAKNLVSSSPFDQLKPVAAVLAPLLTGLAAQLLQKLPP